LRRFAAIRSDSQRLRHVSRPLQFAENNKKILIPTELNISTNQKYISRRFNEFKRGCRRWKIQGFKDSKIQGFKDSKIRFTQMKGVSTQAGGSS
jgi:hypothetical protein